MSRRTHCQPRLMSAREFKLRVQKFNTNRYMLILGALPTTVHTSQPLSTNESHGETPSARIFRRVGNVRSSFPVPSLLRMCCITCWMMTSLQFRQKIARKFVSNVLTAAPNKVKAQDDAQSFISQPTALRFTNFSPPLFPMNSKPDLQNPPHLKCKNPGEVGRAFCQFARIQLKSTIRLQYHHIMGACRRNKSVRKQ